MLERMPAAARGCRRGRRWAVAREAPFSTTDSSRRGPGTAGDLLRTTLQLVDARARVPLEDSWRSWGTSTGHSPGSSLCGAGGLPAPLPGDVALFWPVNSGHQGHAHPSARPPPQEMPPAPPGSSAWTRSPTQAPHRVSHGSGPQKGPRSAGEHPPPTVGWEVLQELPPLGGSAPRQGPELGRAEDGAWWPRWSPGRVGGRAQAAPPGEGPSPPPSL